MAWIINAKTDLPALGLWRSKWALKLTVGVGEELIWICRRERENSQFKEGEVMKQPYIAADGFSYEREAIEAWVRSGHDTSPMTNMKLQHTRLTPNHTLRSLIEDWHYNRS